MTTPTPTTPVEPHRAPLAHIDVTDAELFELLKAALAPSFVLIRKLGAGGMGIVYLARDPALKRLVAVKVLSPDRAVDAYARARFEREAESVAAISHPNVVAVHSVGELANGIPYLVMQYVDGESMADRIKAEGPLDLDTAKQIIGQVASALAAAHRKGIIHRDIKAANILWDDTAGRALVGDFGIAAVVERRFDSESLRLTQTGTMIGTPAYMSPEQFLGEDITDKVDIYSLGLLGYELLTGDGPYEVSSPKQLPAAHLRDAPRKLSALRPDVDPELETLLGACLEKIPDARPSADDVSRRLARGASVLLEWPPPGLEDLHGGAQGPMSWFVVSSFGVVIPLLIAATASSDSMFRFPWPQVFIWPALSAISAIVAFFGSFRLSKRMQEAFTAARAGYGWGTIVEVLVDERRDTGALITGEREYAGLSPAKRDDFRRARVIREVLRLGAGLWCVGGFFVGVPFAARLLRSPNALIALTLGVPAVLLALSAFLEAREESALARVRSRPGGVRKQIDRVAALATTWRQSFEQITAGLRPGGGFAGRLGRMRVATEAVALAIVLGGLMTGAVMMLPVFNQTISQIAVINYGNVTDRYRDALRMAPYRIAVDPTIPPLRAGQALHSINAAGSTTLEPFEQPVTVRIAQIHELKPVWGPFRENWAGTGAMKQARLGLSPAQRQFLVAAANRPGLDEFAIVARAPAVDYIAAVVAQPVPDGFAEGLVPQLSFAKIGTLAYSRVAQASLDLADGHPALGEQRLREVIGAGFALMKGHDLIENMIGMRIVRIGRDNLVALYQATGRLAEAASISVAIAPAESYDDMGQGSDMAMTPSARLELWRATLRDTLSPPALRWTTATTRLAFEPCGDLRQMLFGPDPSYARDLAAARRLLVRLPGDELIMRISENALNTPVVANELLGTPPAPMRGFLRVVDAISGSHRFSACFMNPGLNPGHF